MNLEEAAAAGAAGALLQPMAYQPLLSHEVLYLYEQASIATPIPLWVYNNPATTRHVFSINELATIATFDNVVGFKDRAANAAEIKHRIEHINNALPAEKATTFNWGFSGETKGSLVLGHGGNTWHSALAGVLPSICVELAQAAVAGRSDRDIAVFADHMQSALNPLTVIMTQYGGIRVTHTISQLRGLDIGDLPQPLRPLPPAVQGLVQLALQSVERSLRSLQEQIEIGGIAAVQNAVVESDPPTLRDLERYQAPVASRRSTSSPQAAPAAIVREPSGITVEYTASHPSADQPQTRAAIRALTAASAVSAVSTRSALSAPSASSTGNGAVAAAGSGQSTRRSRTPHSHIYDEAEGTAATGFNAGPPAPTANLGGLPVPGQPTHTESHQQPVQETRATRAANAAAHPVPPTGSLEGSSPSRNATGPTPTSPTRVSAKARLYNEANRSDLARAAQNILLTGDPEIDQTRVNLERITAPIPTRAQDVPSDQVSPNPAGDGSNYVPRRARPTN
jgi:4-hydroxy-tetrahydrodipicolinate synthase